MLTVYLFAKPEAQLDEKSTIVFPSRQSETIFYYLLCTKQSVYHSEIAKLFWQELPADEALTAWLQLAAQLQPVVGSYLIMTSQQVAFNQQTEHWVDLHVLEALCADETFSIKNRLEEIRTLYRGELLYGLEEAQSTEFIRWLHQQRQAIKSMLRHALQRLTEQALQQSDFSLGFKTTLWWLMLEPGNELAHRLRMQLFWRNNQRSAALLQYNLCCEYLQLQRGIDPSQETRQLSLQIQQEHTLVTAAPEPHRSPTTRRSNHNLPKAFTGFVGREQETATLLNLLRNEKSALVAITGEGGVGKTRLALSVAEKLLADPALTPFPDGIWFVPCVGIDGHSHSAPEQIVIHIGSALGISFQGTSPVFEQICGYLANKSLMLLIDNFEHLTDHLPLLQALIGRAKHLQILLTSRHQLTLPEDSTLRLNGLELPVLHDREMSQPLSDAQVTELLRVPSIQILRNRGKRAWSYFSIQSANGVASARLCHLLAGNPLALELAATLLQGDDLAWLVEELRKNYLLLATDLQDLSPRQRSIHNTIDYTWKMLPPTLASLMAQLSCFRGGISFEAASAVTGASDETIALLLHRSLLQSDEEQKLHVHEMVRQFAGCKLAQDEKLQLAIHQRHSEYFIGRLCRWWEETESQHIVAALQPDLDNIYAAWEWAFEHQLFALLSHAIIPFTQFHIYAELLWDVRLLMDSYYEKLVARLAQPDGLADPSAAQELKSALTYARGAFHYYLSNYETATALMEEAKEQVQRFKYWHLASAIEHILGHICRMTHHLDKAQQHLQQAITYAEAQKQPYLQISPLLYLAIIANQFGQLAEDERYLQQAYHFLQHYPDVSQEAQYHSVYSDTYHAQGRWSEALASAQKTIELISQQRPPNDNFHRVGKILWQSGRYPLAKEILEKVCDNDAKQYHSLYRANTFWHSVWLIDLANLYVAWQQPEQALLYSHLAREYAQKQQQKILLGRALKAEGAAQRQLQQWEPAAANLTQSLALLLEESAFDHACATLTQLIFLHIDQENESETMRNSAHLWQLLHNDRLDGTNAEPIKAWWACYRGLQLIGDPRADEAFHTAAELFQTQLTHIQDQEWKQDFTYQITEHQELFQAIQLARGTL